MPPSRMALRLVRFIVALLSNGCWNALAVFGHCVRRRLFAKTCNGIYYAPIAPWLASP